MNENIKPSFETNIDRYTWVKFYTEFATKLLDYKNDRKTLIEKIKKIFSNIDMNIPKLEKDNNIIDIDPFTIFATFNKGLKIENNVKLIKSYAEEFEIDAPIPDNFDGIPVVMKLSATFYYFIEERGERDIDNLWSLFENALKYSKEQNNKTEQDFIEVFDIVKKQKGVKWNITMGLYWIRPDTFMNLDSVNRQFLLNNDLLCQIKNGKKKEISEVPSGKEYVELIKKCKDIFAQYKSFAELSYSAWYLSSQPDTQAAFWGKNANSDDKNISKAEFLKWFNPLIIALRDLGGTATPKEAREKIIKNENLSDEVISQTRGKTNINKFENEVAFARNYLVYGGYIDNEIRGIWKLTEAGKTVEMTEELASEIFRQGVSKNTSKRGNEGQAIADKGIDSVHYWIYSPGDGASKWDEFYNKGIMGIGWGEIGDLTVFTSKEEIKDKMKETYDPTLSYKNDALAVWQFAKEMKVGDIVFAKKGMHTIIGRGVVTSDYIFDDQVSDTYNNIRKIDWTNKGEWSHPGQAVMKTLTDITKYTDYVEKLNNIFNDETIVNIEVKEKVYDKYTEDDFLREVYMSPDKYSMLVKTLEHKKNIILQGAPGVGKTYAAKRLAYSMMGVRDRDRVKMVQFHQSYSYEDFIMGYRPTSNGGFELHKGAFYDFCKAAEDDDENKYFFIIDEINRGNLSKIFGELFMLIESDKRSIELGLLYSNEKFAVPDNVYIIGMMNTADRSLAMLDYALRRRFAFFEFEPAFSTDSFKEYKSQKDSDKFNKLINCVEELNRKISEDETLGNGFRIGHSYFCTEKEITDEWLTSVVEFELIPLLNEYWFDEASKVREWSDRLRSAIK